MHDVGCPSISFCLILLVVAVTLQSNLVRASPNPYPNELEEIAAEKRAWNNFHGGLGKRAWNNFNGGYGKRAWNNFSGGYGKRAWNNFNGGYGKRSAESLDEGEVQSK